MGVHSNNSCLDSNLESGLCQEPLFRFDGCLTLPHAGYSLSPVPRGDSVCVVAQGDGHFQWSCAKPSPDGCTIFRRYGKSDGSGRSRYDGSLCGGCPWLLIYPFVAESETKSLRFRQNSAYIRLSKGTSIEHLCGNRIITWTVGESAASFSLGIDFGKAVHQFTVELRRKYGRNLSFAWVEHKPKAGSLYLDKEGRSRVSQGHYNRHFVVAGSGKLDMAWLDKACLRLFGVHESKLSEVKSRHGYAFYLSSYLTKENEEFVRVRFSQNFVFPGWVALDKAFKADRGRYLEVSELAELKSNESLRSKFVTELLMRDRFVCANGLRRDVKAIARRLGISPRLYLGR